MPKKPKRQLELFAAHDEKEIHALGLLGWRDPLWTTKFAVELRSGEHLTLDLATVRRLRQVALPSFAAGAETPSPETDRPK